MNGSEQRCFLIVARTSRPETRSALLLFIKQLDLETSKSLRYVDAVFSVFDRRPLTKILLDRGADIEAKNEDGSTPLHQAAVKGNVEVLKVSVAVFISGR